MLNHRIMLCHPIIVIVTKAFFEDRYFRWSVNRECKWLSMKGDFHIITYFISKGAPLQYPLSKYIDLFHNAGQVLKFSSKITKWVFRRVEEALAAAKKMDDQLKKVISCATPERTSCLSKDALTMDDVLTKMMDL